MIQTSKETVILRNQSKTCIYVRVEVDLEPSRRRLGGILKAVWRRLGASGRRRGAARRRLVKHTRPSSSNRPRYSAEISWPQVVSEAQGLSIWLDI